MGEDVEQRVRVVVSSRGEVEDSRYRETERGEGESERKEAAKRLDAARARTRSVITQRTHKGKRTRVGDGATRGTLLIRRRRLGGLYTKGAVPTHGHSRPYRTGVSAGSIKEGDGGMKEKEIQSKEREKVRKGNEVGRTKLLRY